MNEPSLERDGFCLLPAAVSTESIKQLLRIFGETFSDDSEGIRARSSRGHVYAARNLVQNVPEGTTVWRCEQLVSFLRQQLGDRFGLVRALFFDKPPNRSWNLPWHDFVSVEQESVSRILSAVEQL